MNKAECPRVAIRMECPECGYPMCESRFLLDKRLPHYLTQCEDVIEEDLFEFGEKLAKELDVTEMFYRNCTNITEMLIHKEQNLGITIHDAMVAESD